MYKKISSCPYCDLKFSLDDDSANHVRWCEKNPNRKKYLKYLLKKCKKCGIEFSHPRNVCCSDKCAKTHTIENKNTLSVSRTRYLKNNPDNHPWKNKDKFNSVPCQIVKDYLKSKNISFVEEWNPIKDRFFSIDIAFPDIKLGIEINGNQHYNRDGTLKKYYQDRHNLIVKSGWKLIELHYSVAWNLSSLDNILSERIQPDYSEYIKTQKEKQQKPIPLKRGVKISERSSKKWEPYKELVKKSGIDFSKFGWGVPLAKILNTTPAYAKRWMKKYLPEIYYNICFKVNRKSLVE